MKTSSTFSLVSLIDPKKSSTYERKIPITFDVDWAVNEIIEDVLTLCASYNVPVTIFATHETSALSMEVQRNNNADSYNNGMVRPIP